MKIPLILVILLTLFSLNTYAQDYSQWDLPEGATQRLGKGWIREIQYSPTRTHLAVAGSIGIWIYDTTTNREIDLLTGHTSTVNAMAYSPDGNMIASGSSDGSIRFWDAVTGDEISTIWGHEDAIRSLAFSEDGATLASGGDDKTIRIWDVSTGEELRTITGHTDWVNSVAFSPTRNILASGSWDHTVRLWDLDTGEEIRRRIHRLSGLWLSVPAK